MRVVVRADSSCDIGTGHVMRCLVLAHALRDKGAEICFVCRDLSGDLRSSITSAGFSVETLTASPEAPLNQNDDAAQTISTIDRRFGRADLLVVDHYKLGADWESHVKTVASKVFVIDDLADRNHDADILLDQNFHPSGADRFRDLVSSKCQVLVGPRYALLRSEFANARKKVVPRSGEVHNIVVSFGGADATGMTLRTVNALASLDPTGLTVDVLVGTANQNFPEIQKRAGEVGFHCHQNASVVDFFSKADLAIGAGGGTMWERACLGVPSVIVALAPNQEPGSLAIGNEGFGLYLGRAEDLTDSQLRCEIASILHNEPLRRFLSSRSMELVDGLGATRVVRELFPAAVSLRRAEESDSRNMHQWRNAEHVRAASFDQREIPWEQHDQWFKSTLQNPKRVLLVATSQNEPVGVMRYDLREEEATVSIYLVGTKSGQGIGPAMLKAGNAWLNVNKPEIRRVLAEIREENRVSHSAFLNAGYKPFARIYEFQLNRPAAVAEIAQ